MMPTAWASILLVLLFLGGSIPSVHAQPAPAHSPRLSAFDQHIGHIVFLMQENHAFDSLFGEYCPTFGTYCPSIAAGIPAGTCVPRNPANLSNGCVRPYNFTAAQLAPPDMWHDWTSTHTAWNLGAMNGFLSAEKSVETFGHYNASTVPLYYDLAEEYGLADNFFSGSQSYSLANHWDMVASTPPPISQKNYIGSSIAIDKTYLKQANHTASLESELLNSSVSWRSYDFSLPPYPGAIGGVAGVPAVAFDYWNPLAARAQSYLSAVKSHFVPRSNFFGDAANGTLPNVSWVIPSPADSDHPPYNLTTGQDWVASVVDAVERSPEWNSTVLFLSWDEYGGFYDHVAPPYLDPWGAGFRVPLLAVGPWVRQGFVDHSSMSFESVLHLMEKRFALPCLGPRDCQAALPLALFNFHRSAPRAPIGFPTNGTATYPMPLQSWGTLPYYGPDSPSSIPASFADDPGSAPVLDWS